MIRASHRDALSYQTLAYSTHTWSSAALILHGVHQPHTAGCLRTTGAVRCLFQCSTLGWHCGGGCWSSISVRRADLYGDLTIPGEREGLSMCPSTDGEANDGGRRALACDGGDGAYEPGNPCVGRLYMSPYEDTGGEAEENACRPRRALAFDGGGGGDASGPPGPRTGSGALANDGLRRASGGPGWSASPLVSAISVQGRTTIVVRRRIKVGLQKLAGHRRPCCAQYR